MMRSAFRAVALFLAVSLPQVAVHAATADNLFAAVKSKDLTALAAMVERGADVNARNDAGQTPLMMAAMEHDSEKLIDLLIYQGADIRARDKDGMTALMYAAQKGELQNAEQLLQWGIDPDIKDNTGKTVMDYAKAGGLTSEVAGKPSFVSMLMGKNHPSEGTPAYTFYIPYKPGTIGAKEFEEAAVRALTRKGWGVSEMSGTAARVFYARVRQRRLYKVEVILEPARIAIRFRPGFGFYGDRGYLESVRAGMMYELALY
jgi:hypothetical protein